uniref:Glycosyltransferase n=1 Tax=Picea sitchensis TaxID=3332 RepID=B8LL12_PICSI|nr:unknown [Picea sitchensis]
MALLNKRPHAVMLPFPAQGPINAMMQLAQILYARGFYITFVNTQYVQERISRSGSVESVKSPPDFRFETLPDGLPPEHGRTSKLAELSRSFTDNGPPYFDKLMDKLKHSQPDGVPPVTCIVSDGLVSFPQKIARKLGVPRVSFWTHSACGFSTYFFAPLLVEKGYIPLKDERCLTNGYMEQIIPSIPGLPHLRIKDLSFSLLRMNMLEFVKSEGQAALEADLILLNTFEDLDRPVIDALRDRLPPLYTIGPLGLLSESANDTISDISASMWTEETSCVKWLDCQDPSSVIYVSFGSITVMSREELLEIAWGLEASKQPFLWVIRPGLIDGQPDVLPTEFLERVKDRSFLVRWAPQMKVLSHPSVGGFLTHSGWNSTLESICAGVPMISRPFLAEQPTNGRFASEVWKIGVAMSEDVKREDVEDLVRRLMRGEEGQQMRKTVGELRDASIRAVREGGSSYTSMEKFVQEIKRGLDCE